MSDEGHRLTDNILEGLEKDLLDMYKESYKTIKPQLEDVRAIIEGLNEEENPVKRLVLQRRQQRLETLLNDIARDIKNTNLEASKMINNEMLNVFEENINYGYYFMEHEGGYNLNTNLYNKNIIKKLYADNENPFTKISLKNITDKSRVYRDLRRHFSAGIRNGETIQELAKRVQGVVNKNLNHSVRIARTETTRLESMGREESFKQGQKMGLKMKKVWISTTDKRTRTSHILLNGKTIDMDKKFSNGLLYPGEYGGKAHEVINCRCTHIVELQGLEPGATIEKDNTVKDMSYSEWKKDKGIIKEEVKKATNVEGKEIIFKLDNMKEANRKRVEKYITELSNKYNTKLKSVEQGVNGKKCAGFVDINYEMHLSSTKPHTIVHEFSHSIAYSETDKLGLTNDKEFWKEIKKIRTQYNKEVKAGNIKEISDYANTNIDEFMAEAFTHAYLKDTGLLEWNYGNDFTYSEKVLKIIDKYFKKR